MHQSGANPIELARQVAVGEFSSDVCAWLQTGFARHLADKEPIENALRLDRASRIRQRNEALREAARLLEIPDDQGAPWPIAVRLARAIAFRARMRRAPETSIERAIEAVFSPGVSVPSTPRQLYSLIA